MWPKCGKPHVLDVCLTYVTIYALTIFKNIAILEYWNLRKKHDFQDYFGILKLDIFKMSIFKNPGLLEMKKMMILGFRA